MFNPTNKYLTERSVLLQAIRQFFIAQGFLEVQTPTRITRPALEDYIDAIPSSTMWLRTSPELHMKQMVGAGMKKIFQIGPCFRANEHGKKHRCEFTMLEWYEADADYRDLIGFTRDLICACADALDVSPPGNWTERTVDGVFRELTGMSAQAACKEASFDSLLVEVVEPALDGAVFLMDYPAELGALARVSPDNPAIAERWELYIDGLEIANTYSELIDPVEQRRRFLETAALRRADGREVYPLDEDFLEALGRMPPTAGSALGVDRLLMALIGTTDINDVIAFTEEN